MAQKKKTAKKPVHKSSSATSAGASDNALGVRPLGDRVLVRPLSPEELGHTSAFGIIIPDTVSKEKSDRGTVVAVGAGRKNEKGDRTPLEVKVGDRVLYTKPWSDPVKIAGVEYYLVAESEILAIIK